jgi:hypothetical protein
LAAIGILVLLLLPEVASELGIDLTVIALPTAAFGAASAQGQEVGHPGLCATRPRGARCTHSSQERRALSALRILQLLCPRHRRGGAPITGVSQ